MPPKSILLLADPVFDRQDERLKTLAAKEKTVAGQTIDKTAPRDFGLNVKAALKDTNFSIERLPGTRQEAEGISALLPAGQVDRAYDFDASRATRCSS